MPVESSGCMRCTASALTANRTSAPEGLQTACLLFALLRLRWPAPYLPDLQHFSCRRRPTAAAFPGPPHGPHAVAA